VPAGSFTADIIANRAQVAGEFTEHAGDLVDLLDA
jgi:hypothetical protein